MSNPFHPSSDSVSALPDVPSYLPDSGNLPYTRENSTDAKGLFQPNNDAIKSTLDHFGELMLINTEKHGTTQLEKSLGDALKSGTRADVIKAVDDLSTKVYEDAASHKEGMAAVQKVLEAAKMKVTLTDKGASVLDGKNPRPIDFIPFPPKADAPAAVFKAATEEYKNRFMNQKGNHEAERGDLANAMDVFAGKLYDGSNSNKQGLDAVQAAFGEMFGKGNVTQRDNAVVVEINKNNKKIVFTYTPDHPKK